MRIQATERELIDPGFRRVYQPIAHDNEPPVIASRKGQLAMLRKGDKVKPKRVRVSKQTAMRPTMSEAELIRAMQVNGIGRPSTYASTIQNLVERGYIERNRDGKIIITTRGRTASEFLDKRFPELFDAAYTARLEASLDEIAQGKTTYSDVVHMFWTELLRFLDSKSP